MIDGMERSQSATGTGLAVGGDVEQALADVGVPSYVLDSTGIVRWLNAAAEGLLGDVRGRHFTSVVAPEDGRRARELVSQKLLGTTSSTDSPGVLISTRGARVPVEISAVPLRNGDRVVGVFGLLEERADDESMVPPPPHLTPSAGRGAAPAGAGPLDEADRRRAPPQHGDRQESRPPSLPRSRRQHEARSRRRRPAPLTRRHLTAGTWPVWV